MSNNASQIAIYLRLLYGGGAERVMVNLMHGFVQQGLQVDLVMNGVDGPYLGQVPPEVRIIGLQAPRMLEALPKLARYLRTERPAVLLSALHYNNEMALWAKRLSGTATRTIVSEHNTLSLHAQNRQSDRWSSLLARLFYPWADGIVAVSQGVAQDLVKVTGLPAHRIRSIYNPIITPELQQQSKVAVDHPWFLPEQPPVILGVGRLEAQKDFPTLIRAFAIARKVQPARLVILGSGQERQQLNHLVKELGVKDDVAFLGFVNNPYAYIAKAAVFVLSSAWEGFGNVIVEALSLGTPVVSTDCPNGPAEILNRGQYGELVSVGDSQAMAEAILRVLSGQGKSVDSAWLEQFTLASVTQQYLDVMGIAVESPLRICTNNLGWL